MFKRSILIFALLIIYFNVLPSYNVYNPKYIQEFDKHSWENIKNLFEINSEYSSMNIHRVYVSEDSVEYTHEIGFLVVTGLLSKIHSIEWDDNQKEEITDFLLQYYNKYTSDPNFQKDLELLNIDNDSFNPDMIKSKPFTWLPYRYEHGYTLAEKTIIPSKIISVILRLNSVRALTLIKTVWINYYNNSLENSFYFDKFSSIIITRLKDNLSKTDSKETKQALFKMFNDIISSINDPLKKLSAIEKLSYFFKVKEIFEINDQKKAWEHLASQPEILKKSNELDYEYFKKIPWHSYEVMRDAYHDIEDNILFKLEEKANGNEKDYYSMMLMTMLNTYNLHNKERKLTESKFEEYKNVIENLAKRTKDQKMITACDNVLKNAKNNMK